eukprot:TRINITY_DN16206_c0_g1_i1.p1 TRINITY_DN16206_c0_g1~~TRINITY_DN16206_c0_g1_i1.p1  ORF type:complete len:446 (-),score=106.88 TRINITY_DN16206_c0_g1_i1:103-1440(-)
MSWRIVSGLLLLPIFVCCLPALPAPPSTPQLSVPARVKPNQGFLTCNASGCTPIPAFVGVNLGISTPGHEPGELAPSSEDYLRWLQTSSDLGMNMIRVYTILPPHFYHVLHQFNQASSVDQQVRLFQGVWFPEERLHGPVDAWSVAEECRREIDAAVGVVHGAVQIEYQRGKAHGTFTQDVAEYMLGFIIGVEWDPRMVEHTNRLAEPHSCGGTYFKSKSNASSFECFLGAMLEHAALAQVAHGWQHPLGVTNWQTTDPLYHASQPPPPDSYEDYVSVDLTNIAPQPTWLAGYFASVHAYPYYPQWMHHEYQDSSDPFQGYLKALREYHAERGLPLLLGETGLSSSIGRASDGPLGRSHGGLTEQSQLQKVGELVEAALLEAYVGVLIFALNDELFKRNWNILAGAEQRRQLWINPYSALIPCLLYTSDAADEEDSVDLGGRRII